MSGAIETVSEQKCFDGVQGFYSRRSAETGTGMCFAVYRPPQAGAGPFLARATEPELFETACARAGQAPTPRRRPGAYRLEYDFL